MVRRRRAAHRGTRRTPAAGASAARTQSGLHIVGGFEPTNRRRAGRGRQAGSCGWSETRTRGSGRRACCTGGACSSTPTRANTTVAAAVPPPLARPSNPPHTANTSAPQLGYSPIEVKLLTQGTGEVEGGRSRWAFLLVRTASRLSSAAHPGPSTIMLRCERGAEAAERLAARSSARG